MTELPVELEVVQSFLKRHNVPFDRWGIEGPKTLGHLMLEIRAGESALIETSEGKLYRLLGAVSVTVVHSSGKQVWYLHEVEQIFSNGGNLCRGWPYVSGKIFAGESPSEAAIRELEEEISLRGADVRFVRSYRKISKSSSFPGLPTLYVVFEFHCQIPADFYNPLGYRVTDKKGTEMVFRWKKEEDRKDDPSDP